MIWNSLKFRLLLGAAVFIAAALIIYSAALTRLFEEQVSERLYAEMDAHLTQLITLLEFDENGRVVVADTLDNPRFDRPFGGLYWQVSAENGSFASRSLWDQTIELPLSDSKPGQVERQRDINSNAGVLMAIKRSVVVGSGEDTQKVDLIVARDQGELDEILAGFSWQVLFLVGLLALFLMMAAAAQVLIGLRPLNTVRRHLSDMVAAKTNSLEGEFPSEVQPLVSGINELLSERASMVERARSGASDLAHGLKTPLAILLAEARSLREAGDSNVAEEIERQIEVMNQHVERQLARARAGSHVGSHQGLLKMGTELQPALEKLLNAFRQLPRGDLIDWKLAVEKDISADIDPMDFDEIVGNLLDNGRKWTRDQVSITAQESSGAVEISIVDNGPGVSDDNLQHILTRGGRLDESSPGSGLGLAIASDIVEIYKGTLTLENPHSGGFKVVLRLPISPVPKG